MPYTPYLNESGHLHPKQREVKWPAPSKLKGIEIEWKWPPPSNCRLHPNYREVTTSIKNGGEWPPPSKLKGSGYLHRS